MDVFTKRVLFIATITFLGLLECSALFIYVYDSIHGTTVPMFAGNLITGGLIYATTSLGISHGAFISLNGTPVPATTETEKAA